MSTTPTPTADAPMTTVTLVSHTGLIYWWPVWLIGFLFAAMSYYEGNRLAVVPPGTTVKEIEPGKKYELTVTGETASLAAAAAASEGQDAFPVRVSRSKSYGMIYFAAILAVVFGSNVPLRGMASLAAILLILLMTVMFAYFGMWDTIFGYLGGLHVEISAEGYLIASVGLLVLWLLVVLFYDPLRFIVFTPGQLVVHKDIGDVRQVYDTAQFVAEKQPTDLFRHWVLGLGAGDLILKLTSQGVVIEFPSVMFVDKRLTQISELMKTRPVTKG